MLNRLLAVGVVVTALALSGADTPRKPFVADAEGIRAFADIPGTIEREMPAIYPYVAWNAVGERVRKLPPVDRRYAAMTAQDYPLEYTFETKVFAELRRQDFIPVEFTELTASGSPTIIVEMAYSKDQVPFGLEKGKTCSIASSRLWISGFDGMVVSVVDEGLRSSRVRVSIITDATDKKGRPFRVTRFREYEFQPHTVAKPDTPHSWKIVAHDGHARHHLGTNTGIQRALRTPSVAQGSNGDAVRRHKPEESRGGKSRTR